MPRKTKSASANPAKTAGAQPIDEEAAALVAALQRMGRKQVRDGMARFAIPSDKAFGIPVGGLQKLARQRRSPDGKRNHELAAALWKAGWYEARMLAVFLDEPEWVTPAQMERWCRDFDSWAICDTACFHLFDRTPHAWRKVKQWAGREAEFVKRAAFALLASLALHDKDTEDEPFASSLPLVERAADDPRNFVKKGVSWALRGIGRRGVPLHAAAVAVAQRLAERDEPAARWIGKDALRDLNSAAVERRLNARRPVPQR